MWWLAFWSPWFDVPTIEDCHLECKLRSFLPSYFLSSYFIAATKMELRNSESSFSSTLKISDSTHSTREGAIKTRICLLLPSVYILKLVHFYWTYFNKVKGFPKTCWKITYGIRMTWSNYESKQDGLRSITESTAFMATGLLLFIGDSWDNDENKKVRIQDWWEQQKTNHKWTRGLKSFNCIRRMKLALEVLLSGQHPCLDLPSAELGHSSE